MIEWYRDRARTIVAELVSTQADRMGLSIRGIRITGAQRRWGSCSSSGNLNFSYRIVMAPEEVIRYVVVHELSHLVEQNHSQRFWSLLERIMPEYRKHRSWLRENGYTLTL
jgi:predicted metal-dependent hydrolase